MTKVEVRTLTPKLTWRAKARLRAGLSPRVRGGQPGNRNRLKHGRYSKAFLARRAHNRGILRDTRVLIAKLNFAAKLRRALQNFPPPSKAWRGLSEAKGAGLTRKRFDTAQTSNATSSRKPTPAPSARPLQLRWKEDIFSKTPPSLRAYLAATEGHP
jgi:hypothetical protein